MFKGSFQAKPTRDLVCGNAMSSGHLQESSLCGFGSCEGKSITQEKVDCLKPAAVLM